MNNTNNPGGTIHSEPCTEPLQTTAKPTQPNDQRRELNNMLAQLAAHGNNAALAQLWDQQAGYEYDVLALVRSEPQHSPSRRADVRRF